MRTETRSPSLNRENREHARGIIFPYRTVSEHLLSSMGPIVRSSSIGCAIEPEGLQKHD